MPHRRIPAASGTSGGCFADAKHSSSARKNSGKALLAVFFRNYFRNLRALRPRSLNLRVEQTRKCIYSLLYQVLLAIRSDVEAFGRGLNQATTLQVVHTQFGIRCSRSFNATDTGFHLFARRHNFPLRSGFTGVPFNEVTFACHVQGIEVGLHGIRANDS